MLSRPMPGRPPRPGASRTRHMTIALLALATVACGTSAPPATTPAPVLTPAQRAEQAARAAIAAEHTVDVATLPANTIGIPPLTVRVSDTTLAPLGYGLADLLATDLARSPKLVVVERLRLDAIMRESQLAKSGALDSATAPRLGRLTGARRLELGLLAGDSAGLDGELRIDLRIADVATGQLTQVVSAHAPVERVLDAEVELALRTYEALGIVLTPAEKAAIEQNRTKNFAALLAYSRGVRAEANGDYQQAASEYRIALGADPSFAPAKSNLANIEPPANPVQSGTPQQTFTGGGVAAMGDNLTGAVNPSPGDVQTGTAKGASSQGNASQNQNTAPPDPVPVRLIIPITRTP